MRRVISIVSLSLNSAGALRALLSRNIVTSALPRSGRAVVPEKITSSIAAARIDLCDVSPITQRSASSRFDLPHPFGPTTPVRPGSMTSSVGSTKDLNPRIRSRVIFMSSRSPRCLLFVAQDRCEPGLRTCCRRRRAAVVFGLVDVIGDLGDRQLFLDELSTDEKIRCSDDAELAPAVLHPLEVRDHALILQAGVKLRTRHPHLSRDGKN